MIEDIFNIIIIMLSMMLAVSIIFNLIQARNINENNRSQKARIQMVILLIIYIVYGVARNIL